MAEEPDKESKTEEPTEKKFRDALDQGNVPYSREAATLASLLGILVVPSFFLVSGVAHLNSSLHRLVDNPGAWSLEGHADVSRLFRAVGLDAARLLVTAVIVLEAAGILSSVLQNSPRLVLDRILPDLSRLSISKGWRRIFGTHGQLEFLKATFKLGAVGLLGLMVLRSAHNNVVNALFMEPAALPTLILDMASRLVGTVDGGRGHHNPRRGGRGLVARLLAARIAHDAPGGQGRVEAGRRRSDRQGTAA